MVALVRHRARQAWHRYILETRLRGLDGLEDDNGDVPGLPGWTYKYHGIGCCLQGPDGELVDVDLHDELAAVIDPWFFAWRIRSIQNRDWPEVRLWRWMPSDGIIVAALGELRAGNVIAPERGDHLFRLAPELEDRVGVVSRSDFGSPTVRAAWAAALQDSNDDGTITAHRSWFIELAHKPTVSYHVLPAAEKLLPPDEFERLCVRVIDGPIGPGVGRAIELLGMRGSPDTEQHISDLLNRISPTQDLPGPAYQALRFLLERQRSDGRVAAQFQLFSSVERASGFKGNPFTGDYAALALRFLPALAMPLVRAALRSTTPVCVSTIAALLAAVDQPWCIRELRSALGEDPGRTYLAEALRRTTSELARRAGDAVYQPPPESPPGQGFTYEEVLHNSVGPLFDEPFRTAQLHAVLIREKYPAGWEG